MSSPGTRTEQAAGAPRALDQAVAKLVPGDVQLREGYAVVGEQTQHYVEAGEGPLVVLLHGFPEFWFGWRLQIATLAVAGFRVVAPDMRGYNLSSRPTGFAAYAADEVAADIRGLIAERGAESAFVVGHDWGGSVAWTLAMNHPEAVGRLAILDAAHPRSLQKGLRNPRQLLRSWYFFFFAPQGLAEPIVRADRFRFLRRFLRDARPPFSAQEIDRYVEAWSQPGALTAMLDYYRYSVRDRNAGAKIRTVAAPTLVIFGQNDRYLGPGVRQPARDDVPNLERVEQVPNASHWVHHDAAERVNQMLIEFFAPARPAASP